VFEYLINQILFTVSRWI